MLFCQFVKLAAFASLAKAVELTGYEYVVVGSGAGGGPLAARLALAGHKTLLIEAGDDQGANQNYTVPSFNAKVSEDPNLAWNFFVKHYADEERQARDFKTSYTTPDGGEYTGLSPPSGSVQKGTLYPRTGTLGGCTAHNALIAVYPHQSDFENIASITGDSSWSPDAMRKYFVKLEKNAYLTSGNGHGYKGWLGTQYAPIDIVTSDPQLLSLVGGAAFALGNATDVIVNLATLLAGDANANTDARDSEPGLFQIPLSTADGKRTGSREFVVAVRDAKHANGTKMYPLDVRLHSHVTKVTFDETVTPPRATGVEFLDGQYLYKASPKNTGAKGTAGSATASREVIVAGGTYNSPQLLKLSGVGPADELKKHSIPVVVDLPGVGTNLQDHYEISVQGEVKNDFAALDGCTFKGDSADACIDRYNTPVLGNRGIYASPGLGANMFYKSSVAENNNWDIFAFGGPVNFRGYFPNYSINATAVHNLFSWAILKAHPRNNAGTVTLQSADPLDVPAITYNYFDTGVGEFEKDVTAMTEAIALTRDAFKRQLVPITEVLPGKDVDTAEEIADYIKDSAWGHHASSTCPIGADDDKMAVLDSSFKVRGTTGLRVVDASVFPRIPGTFTAVSTYMVAEKAADVILAAAAA
ncbi:Choline dehydrogenase [Ascochyta rabiei]|uniref:Choline dehydrogenase n=1 Tax=Didymella rabiei TaxID=5454 RepID=A0A163MFP4_DIDRA|nr:Choline dehydrogenase [Ascochyta rabiei]KZM28676.1 choline dehydrogenase [Ascochyta rabiei]UPX19882.1 Choline dehydrogenase [Ascochyta rabiei]